MSIRDVIAVLNEMEANGVIDRYAIGGAVGATFYLEPVATLDVDVFVASIPNREHCWRTRSRSCLARLPRGAPRPSSARLARSVGGKPAGDGAPVTPHGVGPGAPAGNRESGAMNASRAVL